MKIISKTPENQNLMPSTQKVPSIPKTEPTKKVAKPVKAREDGLSEQAPRKPRPTRVENKQPSQESYFSQSLDRFYSLLRFNITFKLTLGYTIRIVALIAFLFVFVYASFSYYLFYSGQNVLNDELSYLEQLIQRHQSYDYDALKEYLADHQLSFNVYDQNQALVFSSNDDSFSYAQATRSTEFDFRNFPNYPAVYAYGSTLLENGSMIHYALKSELTVQTETLEATFPIGFVLCIALVLSSIRSASKMSKRHLKPILVMTEQVKDMSANNLSTRLNVSGTKDELKDLAITFNQMLDDIQKSYEREKQFVSDASHELRTPIAVIKGYAGMLNRWGKEDPAILEESIQAILGETDNMHSLVESLLFIARNDKGTLKMDKAPFNFSDLFTEIVKETRLIDANHQIDDSIAQSILIDGSADKLKQALRVFIDNSIKYTPDQGQIHLSLKRETHLAVLKISDNGIGISKEDLPYIFDRFYRADKSRTKLRENQHGGTGLGLSIAKIIIEQHGGVIKVESELNEGTTFTLTLPIIINE